jgi:Secretion system C-terminal sorting domain
MKNLFFLFLQVVITTSLQAQAAKNISYTDETDSFSVNAVQSSASESIAVLSENKNEWLASSTTDYFRSVASGFWNVAATWESSADNITWVPATLTPNNLANTIYIRNGHIVNINANQDLDQVIIQAGGNLTLSFGTLNVFDDASGDDIIVQNGGVFNLTDFGNPPVFMTATATANINTGGILRVSAGGLTATGVGVNIANFVYQNASVLELATTIITSNNVVFFPNVNAVTIPVFRTTIALSIGNNSTVTFNGVFEAAGGTVSFVNTGTKTFRNGITGTSDINGSTSGKFFINGATAGLGGTGVLTLPATGMDIGTNNTVTMISGKSVTGNINLLANAFVKLNNYNLTMTGTVSGGSSTAHVITNGSGKLVINNIGAAVTLFPVGANAATFNPMSIFNGGGFSYGVRVALGFYAPITIPVTAVNRTWFVTPTGGVPGTVNTNFFYYPGEGNAGFNYTANLELGQHTGVWNVIRTGIIPSGSYQVATTASTLGNNIEAPLVLANLGSILASSQAVAVNYFTGIKQNNKHILNWKLTCNSTPSVTLVLQRSTDGINYGAVFSEYATAFRCEQPFNYTDNQPATGINYYRIKMTDADGKITYSKVVPLINGVKGFDILNIAPNPIVNSSFNLQISSAEKTQIASTITDMMGRVLQKQTISLIAGFNTIPMNVRNLAAGTYQLAVNTADDMTKVLRFVIQ